VCVWEREREIMSDLWLILQWLVFISSPSSSSSLSLHPNTTNCWQPDTLVNGEMCHTHTHTHTHGSALQQSHRIINQTWFLHNTAFQNEETHTDGNKQQTKPTQKYQTQSFCCTHTHTHTHTAAQMRDLLHTGTHVVMRLRRSCPQPLMTLEVRILTVTMTTCNARLKGILTQKWKSCHHLLTLKLLQTCMCFIKISPFVFSRRKKLIQVYNNLRGGVNDDRIFIFGWSIALRNVPQIENTQFQVEQMKMSLISLTRGWIGTKCCFCLYSWDI